MIALTGRKPPIYQHRNTYQELPHEPLFASVTKFSADVADAADLPRLLRQAWREAMTGSPRPGASRSVWTLGEGGGDRHGERARRSPNRRCS